MEYTNAGLCNALLHEDRRAIDTIGTFIRPIIEAEIVNREDREDVRQHCMLEIIEFLRRTDEIHNIWALARRISINSVIDFKRSSVSSAKIIFPTEDGSHPEAESPSRTGSASVLKEIALRDQLHYILKSISNRCRQIFQALFVEEASYAEASARMGITEGNLRVRLNRCRDQALSIRKRVFGY